MPDRLGHAEHRLLCTDWNPKLLHKNGCETAYHPHNVLPSREKVWSVFPPADDSLSTGLTQYHICLIGRWAVSPWAVITIFHRIVRLTREAPPLAS